MNSEPNHSTLIAQWVVAATGFGGWVTAETKRRWDQRKELADLKRKQDRAEVNEDVELTKVAAQMFESFSKTQSSEISRLTRAIEAKDNHILELTALVERLRVEVIELRAELAKATK